MPVIDESQVRTACDLNARLNWPREMAPMSETGDSALPALLAELQAAADLPLSESRTLPA